MNDERVVRASIVPTSPEMAWRCVPNPQPRCDSSIRVASWRGAARGRECYTEGSDGDVVVDVSTGTGSACLTVAGRRVHDGAFRFGTAHATGPGQEARCVWHEPFEAVHFFVPAGLIRAAVEELGGDAPLALHDLPPRDDPALARLGMLWLDLQQETTGDLTGYGDWLGQAVLARLARTHAVDRRLIRSDRSPLPTWRVQRVAAHVEESMDKRITLSSMAEVARLSPMHFAAQFRRATGLSPHQFLMQRRVERAQDLLRTKSLSLAEIALATGFSSQTHFTTSFRQVTGSTPGRWRRLIE